MRLTNRATITATNDGNLDNNTSVVHNTVEPPAYWVYLPLVMRDYP